MLLRYKTRNKILVPEKDGGWTVTGQFPFYLATSKRFGSRTVFAIDDKRFSFEWVEPTKKPEIGYTAEYYDLAGYGVEWAVYFNSVEVGRGISSHALVADTAARRFIKYHS